TIFASTPADCDSQSRKLAGATLSRSKGSAPGAVSQRRTRRGRFGNDIDRTTSASRALNMAALAARPTARVATTSTVRPGRFDIPRTANRASRSAWATISPLLRGRRIESFDFFPDLLLRLLRLGHERLFRRDLEPPVARVAG